MPHMLKFVVYVLVSLIIISVLLWGVRRISFFDNNIRVIAYVFLVIVACFWFLELFGITTWSGTHF